MIVNIHIQNFTIITSLDLEFTSGMTVLTGETGAGKSIIIDAVNFALGARVDSSLVRHDCERCDVHINFDIRQNYAAQQWLQIQELESQEECLIRRTLTKEGRSRISINGQPVTQQQVKELGSLLVAIYGQHAHQDLLKSEPQRLMLDDYAQVQTLADNVNGLYKQWRKTSERIQTLQTQDRNQTARQDFLRFQLEEFTKLALTANELSQLEVEHKQLAHAEQLMTSCSMAVNQLSETEHNILSQLHQTLQQLKTVSEIHPQIKNAYQTLETARISLQEAEHELRDYVDAVDVNPQHLQQVEERLAQIHNLARKHRIAATELLPMQQQLEKELQQIDGSDAALQQLQQELQMIEAQYREQAALLTQKRTAAAKKLGTLVTEKIRQLGMPKGHFEITLVPEENFSAQGLEKISFLVSVNTGQPLQSLAKVASGGELSRIGLAIKVISTRQNTASTLIFDEVDVGIGGGTAEIVGQLLRQLGQHAQVLCVTHLPQVAVQGHQHLQVEKFNEDDGAYTQIKNLSGQEKVAEIARMLGGLTITQHTLTHAKEMLALVMH